MNAIYATQDNKRPLPNFDALKSFSKYCIDYKMALGKRLTLMKSTLDMSTQHYSLWEVDNKSLSEKKMFDGKTRLCIVIMMKRQLV